MLIGLQVLLSPSFQFLKKMLIPEICFCSLQLPSQSGSSFMRLRFYCLFGLSLSLSLPLRLHLHLMLQVTCHEWFSHYAHVVLLLQIATQSVASARESRINKKGRRGAEHAPARFVYTDLVSQMLLLSHFRIRRWNMTI